MNRRSKDIQGVIRFPVNDLPCSGEGGMVVKLWIIPSESDQGVCCGATTNDVLGETFMGTDCDRYPVWPDLPEDSARAWDMMSLHDQQCDAYFERYWPMMHDGVFWSIPLLACLVLGSTGWSNGEWCAGWSNLSPEGEALIDALRAMYPNATFRLITFLDT